MEPNQAIRVIENPKELFSILKEKELTETKIFILADSSTSEHCLPLILNELPGGGRKAILLNVSDGESTKTLETASLLYTRLMEHNADRSSLLINLGGGMICDLGSFVAGTFKRGMQWINIPTTVLAQVDAAIGGKTGLNHMGVKNMIGTYELALETVVYPGFLKTLPKREVMSGFAEMMKHALISSPKMWKQMVNAEYIDLPFIQNHIEAASKIKTDIVAKDFKESGERKKLNFGHTVGHALESYMFETPDRNLLHGEAVALGIMAETFISHRKGYVTEALLKEISKFITTNYKGIDIHESQFHRLIEIMRQDKKSDGEKLNMTLIKGIGEAVIDRNPTMDIVIDSLTYIQRYPFPK